MAHTKFIKLAPDDQDQVIAELVFRIRALEQTLCTLIAWMAGSANSPISRKEAEQLMRGIGVPEGAGE